MALPKKFRLTTSSTLAFVCGPIFWLALIGSIGSNSTFANIAIGCPRQDDTPNDAKPQPHDPADSADPAKLANSVDQAAADRATDPKSDTNGLDQPQKKYLRPGLIEFKGEIDTGLTRYFFDRFEKAKRDGVDLLVIEIDSPGGLKIESLEIASALSKCNWSHTVALITNEAISGGALVALGCDDIVIATDAKLGNIGEIAFDPEAMAFRLIRPKVESSLGHDARQLALAKGRPADLVEAFVDKDLLVYRRLNRAGTFEYKQVRVDQPNQPADDWELIPETKPERFLTLSGLRAKELELANFHAADIAEMAALYRVQPAEILVYSYTSNDAMVHLLNSPLITTLLIVVGLIALYIEFSAPGIGAGGLVAALCMLLFFWSRYLGGTAGLLEVLLFATGLVFILMELFIIPGFGIPGFLGLALLFFSAVLASQNFTVPQSADQWNQTITSVLVLLASVSIFSVAAVVISKYFGSIPLFNRLILEPPPASFGSPFDRQGRSPTGAQKDAAGKPIQIAHPIVSIGDWGVTESQLRPSGRVKFAGRSVDVISDGTFIEPGSQVKVIRINGNVVTVCEVDEDAV